MGLFGGDSTSVTAPTTTTQNAGFSEVSGPAVAIQGEGNRVSVTDQGAIDAARDIATRSLTSVERAGANQAAVVKDAIASAAESSREGVENIAVTGIKYGALALGVYAALVAVRSFAK